MKKFLLVIIVLPAMLFRTQAQQYTGLEGLLHCPSADMHGKGTGRICLSLLNKDSVPEHFGRNVTAYSLAYSPFNWTELSFTGLVRNIDGTIYQDRMASVKFRVLEEKKWWPSIVLGCNDPLSTIKSSADTNENSHMCNFYVALTKHFNTVAGTFGVHAAYRRFWKTLNARWNGPVGGLTYSPCFYPDAKITAEYDGAGFNLGFNIRMLKHIDFQVLWYNMRSINCGICFEMNL